MMACERNFFGIVAATCVTAACATKLGRQDQMTVTTCVASEICSISGAVVIKTDGHGYIGELRPPDSPECVNVSLPEKQTQDLLGKPGTVIGVSGPVLRFPDDVDVLRFEVNGRRVAYGL